MRKIIFISVIFVLFLYSACGKENSPSKTPAITKAYPIYVENNQFKKDGYTFLMRGINIAGNFKTPDGGKFGYFGNVTEEDFKWLREELGFNTARLLAEWSGIEPEPGKINKKYLKEYALRVSWAAKYHMYVFIDMHQDVYGLGFQKYGGNGAPLWTCPTENYLIQPDVPTWEMGYLTPGVIACEKRFWTDTDNLWNHYEKAVRAILKPFADHPYVLGLEIMNEPFWGPWGPSTFEENYLYPFYLKIGEAIRDVAPRKIIFFEPAASRNMGFYTSLPSLPFPQLAYAPHFYLTSLDLGGTYPGGLTGMLKSSLKARIGEAISMNAVPVIGEFGAWVDKKSVIRYLRDLFNAFEDLKMNVVQWELLDIQRKFEDPQYWKEWIAIVIRPYPEMWKGNIKLMKYNPENKKLHIIWDASGGDDMIITLPHYIYRSTCHLEGKNISFKWINSYQIRVTAEKSGKLEFNIGP